MKPEIVLTELVLQGQVSPVFLSYMEEDIGSQLGM